MTPEQEKTLLYELSRLEHEQWMAWAQHILKTEKISEETIKQWQEYFIPFEKLSPEIQAKDSYFAQKTLSCLKDILKSK